MQAKNAVGFNTPGLLKQRGGFCKGSDVVLEGFLVGFLDPKCIRKAIRRKVPDKQKVLEKPIRNRCPKKYAMFHQFLFDFCGMLQEPTSKKRAPMQCFVSFSHNSVFRFFRAFLVKKPTKNPFKTRSEPVKNRY